MNTKFQKTIKEKSAITKWIDDNMTEDEQKEAERLLKKQIKEDDLNIKGSAKRYNQGKTQLDLNSTGFVLRRVGESLNLWCGKIRKVQLS